MRANKILGIALCQDSLLLAELTTNGNGRRKLVHASDFSFPQKLDLNTPAELGRALAQHLRKHHLSTRDVALGLPAKLFVTRRKDVPPSSPEMAAASLRLQAEAEFASEQDSLVTDYAGQPDPSRATTALLIATSRAHLEACQAMLRSAGLRLRTATATPLALASTALQPSAAAAGRLAFLHVLPTAAELVVTNDGAPMLLSHIPLPAGVDPATTLASEMRRALAGLPSRSGTHLVVSSNSRVDTNLATTLGEKLASPAAAADIASRVQVDDVDPRHYAPAISVALAALQPDASTSINLVDSRLAPPPARSSRRPYAYAAAIAGTLLLASVVALFDLHSRKSQLADMNERLESMADEIKAAEARASRLAFARNWSPGKPIYLGALAALTNLFPDEGSIYATSLSIREGNTGQLTGRATSNQPILALLDRMKDDRHFSSPKLLDMREAGGTSREVAFTISFGIRTVE